MGDEVWEVDGSLSTDACAGLLSIDVTAVLENWRYLNRIVSCGAVVKADAYGLGMEPVACALAREGCRDFFVALPSEGCALRQALPDPMIRIYVLNGPLGNGQDLVNHRLHPVLNSLEQVVTWQQHAPRLPYSLHVDTGMNRLGLALSDLRHLPLDTNPELVMSHLACAETPEHSLNAIQRDRFTEARQKFPNARASFANSAGLFLGDDFLFDLGRPGLALYGGCPLLGHSNSIKPNPIKNVVTLDLTILQIRTIDTDGTVGYGATRAVIPGMRVAVASAGYADGILCSLANRGGGFINGVRIPIIGRVSMDLITFDISMLPENSVSPGDRIRLLGADYTIDEFAKDADTIPYTILTGLSRRYVRNWRGA